MEQQEARLGGKGEGRRADVSLSDVVCGCGSAMPLRWRCGCRCSAVAYVLACGSEKFSGWRSPVRDLRKESRQSTNCAVGSAELSVPDNGVLAGRTPRQ